MNDLRKGMRVLRRQGIKPFVWHGLRYVGIWNPIWNTTTSRYPDGTNIFERDWDMLIILDACRVDSLRTVSDSIPWIDDVDQLRSVGSMSPEWMLKTFTEEYRDEIGKTAFVSGNVWAHRIFEERFHERDDHRYDMIREGLPDWKPVTADAFEHFESVYPISNQNDRLHPEPEGGHIPHIRTDRAIAVAREGSADRIIVHYTLPHLSFIADALDWTPGECSIAELMDGPKHVRDLRPEEKSYDPAKRGDVDVETVRGMFERNLRLALEYVEILLQNVDADRVILSADHGEGFGQNSVWSHPYGYPFSPVKTVPWAEITASDEGTYEPQYDPLDRMPNERDRTRFLKEMGYL